MARAAYGQMRPCTGSTEMYRPRTGEAVRSIHASECAVTHLPSGEGIATAAVLYASTRYPHMRSRPRHGTRRILAWALRHRLHGDVSLLNGRGRTLDLCFMARGHAHAVAICCGGPVAGVVARHDESFFVRKSYDQTVGE